MVDENRTLHIRQVLQALKDYEEGLPEEEKDSLFEVTIKLIESLTDEAGLVLYS